MSAHAVATAHGKEAARLRALEATQRFRQANVAMKHCKDFEQELAEIKGSAVRELRELYGWSWGDCEKEFGLSRARMQQIGTR